MTFIAIEPIAPRFQFSEQQIQSFVEGKLTGAGPLTAELNARPDFQSTQIPPLGTQCGIYEYEWGLVTEHTDTHCTVWSFYVADVWREGTEAFFYRFHNAWKNDAAPVLADLEMCLGKPFDTLCLNGLPAFCCITLQCTNPALVEPVVRPWIGSVLLRTLLPVMVSKVLDPNYTFMRTQP